MRWSKYQVTPEQFPMGYMYPPFCNGPCAAMTTSASEKLYKTASKIIQPQFPLEDVLFTGIYRTEAKMNSISLVPRMCEHFVANKENLLRSRINRLKLRYKNINNI